MQPANRSENTPFNLRNATFFLLFFSVLIFVTFRFDEPVKADKINKFEEQQRHLIVKMLVYQSIWAKNIPSAEGKEVLSALENQIQLLETRTDIFKDAGEIQKQIILHYLVKKPAQVLKSNNDKSSLQQIFKDYDALYVKGVPVSENSEIFNGAPGMLSRFKQLQIKGDNDGAYRLEHAAYKKFESAASIVTLMFFAILILNLLFFFWFRSMKPKPVFDSVVKNIPENSFSILGETPILYLFLLFPVGGVLLSPLLGNVNSILFNLFFQPMLFMVAIYYFLNNGGSREMFRSLLFSGDVKKLYVELVWGIGGFFVIFPVGLMAVMVSLLFFGAGGPETGIRSAHPIVFEMENHPFAVFVIAVLMAPVIEEVLFRSFIYGFLRRSFSVVSAAFLNGFLFAVLHPQGFVALPYLIVLGMGLCILREFRPGIIAPIITHMMVNGFAVGMTYFILG